MAPRRVDLSVVVPVFNEDINIAPFVAVVCPILDEISSDWEILFVNDGSRDGTLDAIRTIIATDPRVSALDLSRNFGKEIALTAGLDHAIGRAVIPIDVDLQDPPELIPVMVAKWREGFDVVLARRVDRSSDSRMKRHTARLFYRVIGRLSRIEIPSDVGDFRLLDAAVISALRAYPERERFMKGIFASVGFKTAVVPYVRARRIAGDSKFKTRALFNLALEGIVSFSTVPLKIWTYIGLVAATSALVYAGFIIVRTMVTGVEVPGYASLLTVILLFNGLTLIGLGVIGEYIARIFAEVKRRPLYLVRETIGRGSGHIAHRLEDADRDQLFLRT